jgi:hypothetical protein
MQHFLVMWDSLCSNTWYGPVKLRTLHWDLTSFIGIANSMRISYKTTLQNEPLYKPYINIMSSKRSVDCSHVTA